MAELDYSYIAGLVVRARTGDPDAFAELYASTYQKQYMFACSYLRDEFLAQDALQETYITALKNLNSLKDPKLFVSWLNQINFRICYNMSGKQARINAETDEFNSETLNTRVEHTPSAETQVVRVDEKEYILQQVMALPFSESQAIFLHYYKDMKIDEIAYMMEISKSSVKRYLASGKKRLSKSLALQRG